MTVRKALVPRNWVKWAAFLALLLAACGTAPQMRKENSKMDELKFKIDRDGSFEPDAAWLRHDNPRLSTRGTPTILSGVGIAINAPREVQFSNGPHLDPEDAQFIVCMASNFVYDTMGYGSSFIESVTLVVVDTHTHQEYSGLAALATRDNGMDNLEPFPSDLPRPTTDHSNTTIGEVLRGNLAQFIRLPAVETEYVVYAAFGPFRSNSLTVKVVRRPTSP